MVTANELCAAIESLLAIDYSKRYMPWREQSVISLARAIARQYRTESETLPPEDVFNLKPSEARTFGEGQVEYLFDLSETTSPGVDVLELQTSVPVEVVPEKVSKSVYWDFDEPEPIIAEEYYQRHPALPD